MTDPVPDGLTTARVEAFSDGVLAIAATVLVFGLAVPPPGRDVATAVVEEVPAIAAYAVSFLTILIFWVNHHALFAAIQRVDRGVLFLNGLILLCISFIGYPTQILGRTLRGDGSGRAASVLYAAVLALASAAFTTLWAYLHSRPQLLHPARRAGTGAALRRSLVGPGLYTAALVVGLVHAGAALVVCALVAAYFALPPRVFRWARP